MKDRKRSGPDDWSSGKYERWLPGASTGPVGNGYYNRPGSSLGSQRSISGEHRVSSFLRKSGLPLCAMEN
ncbi:hypothetical protein PIB30_037353 [Stylosanthes scabra]|uniref:Uncharacterized protein n=1 Tax=Stylosanthes scabra TaxID=79078 RepID=A0ABU6TDW3_9FABA|nr:hypothetical protein [Stylosanthes scabra]